MGAPQWHPNTRKCVGSKASLWERAGVFEAEKVFGFCLFYFACTQWQKAERVKLTLDIYLEGFERV
jgi:hypothetical protein